MILLLDNHDSFVHNLARYLRRLGQATEVVRSDSIDACGCLAMRPTAILISPGPKRPENAGCSVEVVRLLGGVIPILGVCLGHQAIGHAFGASIVRCEGMHGSSSEIWHDGEAVFQGCRQPMRVGRYHSLVIDDATVPDSLVVTARVSAGPCSTGSGSTGSGSTGPGSIEPGLIMGVRHRELPIYGVQFHPESVLSEDGADVLANFVRVSAQWQQANANRRVAS